MNYPFKLFPCGNRCHLDISNKWPTHTSLMPLGDLQCLFIAFLDFNWTTLPMTLCLLQQSFLAFAVEVLLGISTIHSAGCVTHLMEEAWAATVQPPTQIRGHHCNNCSLDPEVWLITLTSLCNSLRLVLLSFTYSNVHQAVLKEHSFWTAELQYNKQTGYNSKCYICLLASEWAIPVSLILNTWFERKEHACKNTVGQPKSNKESVTFSCCSGRIQMWSFQTLNYL